MSTESSRNSIFASVAVRAAGAWLLAGALAKLFMGTPKDLPELVRELTPFGLDLTFHLVIAVELVIVSLSIFKPRWAWLPLVLLYAFFEFVLASQLAADAESCGCFGATIKVPPQLMVAVDAVLLLALLASRPWSRLKGAGLPVPYLAAALAASIAAPWLVISSVPSAPAGAEMSDGAVATALPRYVDLSPEKWLHQNVFEIAELTRWVDAEKLPSDGKLVLWRQSCDHCAAHLRKLTAADDGSVPIVLLQVRDDLDAGRSVDAMPSGPHVTELATPENLQFTITTPWEVDVAGGVVTAVVDAHDAH